MQLCPADCRPWRMGPPLHSDCAAWGLRGSLRAPNFRVRARRRPSDVQNAYVADPAKCPRQPGRIPTWHWWAASRPPWLLLPILPLRPGAVCRVLSSPRCRAKARPAAELPIWGHGATCGRASHLGPFFVSLEAPTAERGCDRPPSHSQRAHFAPARLGPGPSWCPLCAQAQLASPGALLGPGWRSQTLGPAVLGRRGRFRDDSPGHPSAVTGLHCNCATRGLCGPLRAHASEWGRDRGRARSTANLPAVGSWPRSGPQSRFLDLAVSGWRNRTVRHLSQPPAAT